MAFRTNKTPILQTKSASGSVASFNTALAMPLVNGEFSIQAYQEGTGDPSPSNVRNIIGYSALNMTKTGKNLVKNDWEIGYISATGEITPDENSHHTKLIKVNSGDTYCYSGLIKHVGNKRLHGYDINGNWVIQLAYKLAYQIHLDTTFNLSATIPSNVKYVAISNAIDDVNIQLEVGSTATAYEPYVTPTIYTIQLGQEVYGGVYDVDSGVLRVSWKKDILSNPNPIHWAFFPDFDQFYSTSYFSGDDMPLGGKTNLMCETLKPCDTSERATNIGNFIIATATGGLSLSFPDIHSKEDAIAYVNSNPITFIYKLAEPFDIQLTPTQIETLIGDNNIFADTGDIDLTYKDLDIAKIGNFREVFRLPS